MEGFSILWKQEYHLYHSLRSVLMIWGKGAVKPISLQILWLGKPSYLSYSALLLAVTTVMIFICLRSLTLITKFIAVNMGDELKVVQAFLSKLSTYIWFIFITFFFTGTFMIAKEVYFYYKNNWKITYITAFLFYCAVNVRK